MLFLRGLVGLPPEAVPCWAGLELELVAEVFACRFSSWRGVLVGVVGVVGVVFVSIFFVFCLSFEG